MKKAKTPRRDELRRQYKRSDFPGGLVRGKHVAGAAAGVTKRPTGRAKDKRPDSRAR